MNKDYGIYSIEESGSHGDDTSLAYKEAEKVIFFSGEIFGDQSGYLSEPLLQRWNAPHNNEKISQQKYEEVKNHIREHLGIRNLKFVKTEYKYSKQIEFDTFGIDHSLDSCIR